MTQGLNTVLKHRNKVNISAENRSGGIGSRRIFAPQFKLKVLDSYRNDADCKGNQRATARKYGIHRRQIQKWLQAENSLRNIVGKPNSFRLTASECLEGRKLEVTLNEHRQLGDADPATDACAESTARDQDTFSEPSSSSSVSESDFCAPVDFSTHGRRSASPPIEPAHSQSQSPMDLSIKRLSPPLSEATLRPCEDLVRPQPVKLFKPYLDLDQKPTPVSLPASSTNFNYLMPAEAPTVFSLHASHLAFSSPYECWLCSQQQKYNLELKLSPVDSYMKEEYCYMKSHHALRHSAHKKHFKWLKEEDLFWGNVNHVEMSR